jgi:hypothetical protein
VRHYFPASSIVGDAVLVTLHSRNIHEFCLNVLEFRVRQVQEAGSSVDDSMLDLAFDACIFILDSFVIESPPVIQLFDQIMGDCVASVSFFVMASDRNN